MHILGVKNTAIKIGIRYLSETTEELVFFKKKRQTLVKHSNYKGFSIAWFSDQLYLDIL